jgi:RNA 3'-terminal phosphate cyclase (ATP)
MIGIDGSLGEGGGQVVRSAVAMSMVTGRALRIGNIRAGRRKGGLMRQHLTAVRAAAEVCRAGIAGDAVGSRELTFEPGRCVPGEYRFSVGTAGSATLVLQTILPALMTADRASRLTLEGGTHNPWAPPFDFLQKTFLPVLARMGPEVTAELERPGFYPAGGGRFHVSIEPAALEPLELIERGRLRRTRARAVLANLPRHIAERELRVVGRELPLPADALTIEDARGAAGPGNVLFVEVESEHVTEVFSAFGRRGVRAESVAAEVVAEARRYLDAGAAVGEHLADQLLLPLALAGAGRFRTLAPTLHSRTVIELLKQFSETDVRTAQIDEHVWEIAAGPG